MSKVSKQTPIPWVPTTHIIIRKEAENEFFFQSLLDEPNPNSPANSVAAQLYQVTAPPPCHSYNWTKKIFRRIEGSMRRGWLQSWNKAGTISYSCAVWKIVLCQHQSCLGWCFLKRVKARRWKVNLQQTEAAVELIQCQHSSLHPEWCRWVDFADQELLQCQQFKIYL